VDLTAASFAQTARHENAATTAAPMAAQSSPAVLPRSEPRCEVALDTEAVQAETWTATRPADSWPGSIRKAEPAVAGLKHLLVVAAPGQFAEPVLKVGRMHQDFLGNPELAPSSPAVSGHRSAEFVSPPEILRQGFVEQRDGLDASRLSARHGAW